MKEVLIKTYVMHKMLKAYSGMTQDDRATVASGRSWTYKDKDTYEEVKVQIIPNWGWFVYYDGTYGHWRGEIDDPKVKNVSPRNMIARHYRDTKHMVAIS